MLALSLTGHQAAGNVSQENEKHFAAAGSRLQRCCANKWLYRSHSKNILKKTGVPATVSSACYSVECLQQCRVPATVSSGLLRCCAGPMKNQSSDGQRGVEEGPRSLLFALNKPASSSRRPPPRCEPRGVSREGAQFELFCVFLALL